MQLTTMEGSATNHMHFLYHASAATTEKGKVLLPAYCPETHYKTSIHGIKTQGLRHFLRIRTSQLGCLNDILSLTERLILVIILRMIVQLPPNITFPSTSFCTVRRDPNCSIQRNLLKFEAMLHTKQINPFKMPKSTGSIFVKTKYACFLYT